jgi:hypothetical protein
MKLTLKREPSTATSTPGKLYVDDVFFCFTMEDVDRAQFDPTGHLVDPAKWKIDKQTAIPAGTYSVILDYSGRWKKLMPHILSVPGFTAIRMHGGNTDADTEGCILCGEHRDGADRISNCAPIVLELIKKIAAADAVSITVEAAQAEDIRAHALGVKF